MNLAESVYIVSRLRSRRLRESVVPKLIELGGRVDGLAVLDIGCGPGECVACVVDEMGAAKVAAIDIDPKMVGRARRRLAAYGSQITVEEGDVIVLGQADGSVDAVFDFAVLHHVPDWRAGLREIARVLAPGGRFFVQDHDVSNHDWLSKRLFRHPPDRFTNAELLAEMEAEGLTLIGIEDRPGQLLVVAAKEERRTQPTA